MLDPYDSPTLEHYYRASEMLGFRPLSQEVFDEYSVLGQHPEYPALGPIHPFVGKSFDQPRPNSLRMVAVGINAYSLEPDERTSPGMLADWMRKGCHRFYPAVASQCRTLAAAVSRGADYRQLRYDTEEHASLYVTNAVKRFLPGQHGRHAAAVKERWLEEGERVWEAELEAMYRNDALPHVVVVFGDRPWSYVWRAFGSESRPSWVRQYRSRDPNGPLFHRLNVSLRRTRPDPPRVTA